MNGPALWAEPVTTVNASTGVSPGKWGARTSVIALNASHEEVFKTLADIEALARWAPGFCEVVYLDRGNWRGLTVLGELWLEVEVDAREGSVALLAGRQVGDSRRVEWQVISVPDGGTRLSIRVETTADELQKRLFDAVETELWGLTSRWGGGVLSGARERSG